MRVEYPWHAAAGVEVEVLYREQRRGEVVFICRMPDGTGEVVPAALSSVRGLRQDAMAQGLKEPLQRPLQVGGTVPLTHLYLQRPADDELPAALLRGELCYVLAPRQMGKSSLRLRAQAALKAQGVRVAAVDLTTLGGQSGEAGPWYFSLLDNLRQQLGLADPSAFWEGRARGTPVQAFVDYIKEEVAGRLLASDRAVLFIDELDGLLALERVSRDDFLAAVRALYNGRAEEPALSRVTFCLLGAALPGDLIGDERRTPFNVGRAVVLEDFRPEEVAALRERGLDVDGVYDATAGHPYMTMKLCEALREAAEDGEAVTAAALVQRIFFSKGRVRETSLAFAEKHFERASHGDRVDPMLWLYGRLLRGEAVAARAQDPVQGALALTGLCAERGGALQVRNRIVAQVFDAAWVKRQQAERLFTAPLQRWLEAGRSADLLLRGKELQAALAWAAGRGDIAPEERDFLLASQAEGQRRAALRTLVLVLGTALLLVTVLLGISYGQYQVAQRQKEAAQENAQVERGLRAASLVKQPGQETQALALAILAVQPLRPGGALVSRAGEGLVAVADHSAWRHAPALTLAAHTGPVNRVAFSPDGSRIVTASDDRTAKVWDASSAKLLLTLKGHGDSVRSAAFSPDGSRIVTASEDCTAKVWNASSAKLLLTLKGHGSSVSSAAFSPDGSRMVTSSDDRTAEVWDASSAKLLLTLKGHGNSVFSAAFSLDGSRIVTASEDYTAKVWDAFSAKLLLTLKGHGDWVRSAAFSPDGSRIVTASEDYTAKVWDASSAKLLLTLQGHGNFVYSAAFSLDGSRIVTASLDRTAKVWDASSAKLLLTLQGHGNFVHSAAFAPDGSRIVTASTDRTAKVWDASFAKLLLTLQGHGNFVYSAAFAPDGSRIVTASVDRTAKVWDASSANLLLTLKGHGNTVYSAAFSPDGSRIVTASVDRTAKVWDASSAKLLLTLQGHGNDVSSAAFAPDGSRIVTASVDRTAKVWDASSAKLLLTLQGHGNSVLSAAFAPDGSRIVTTSEDRTAKVWDASSAKLLLTLQGHGNFVYSALFSPDGARIVTASADRTAKVWDASSGKLLLTLQGHGNYVSSAAFSPDGSRIVTASVDRTAKAWDTSSGKLLLTLQGHGNYVLSAAFSPDGSSIVTASADSTAKVYPSTVESYLRHDCPVALAINNWGEWGVPQDQADEVRRVCQRWVTPVTPAPAR